MAKLKLLQPETLVVPDIELPLEDGTTVKNVDQITDQITAKIKYATIAEKMRYVHEYTVRTSEGEVKRTNIDIVACIKEKVIDIFGLEEYGIKTGKDLAAYEPPNKVLNELMFWLFNKANGIDDAAANPEDAKKK